MTPGIKRDGQVLKKKPLPDPETRSLIPPDMDHIYFEDAASVPPEPENRGDSPVNAWWFAEASFLAYCHPGFARMAYRLAGFDGFRFFQGRGTEVMAAWNGSLMILAFRGTELRSSSVFHEVFTDLNAALVPFEKGGMVHKGFLAGLEEVWGGPEGLSEFLEKDAGEFPERPLWFCGHSLGAALAALAFVRVPRGTGLYMYGAPRVGDRAFGDLLSGRCVRRFEHAGDPVPQLPPEIPALKLRYEEFGVLSYIGKSGEIGRERPEFSLDDHRSRIRDTRLVQSQRREELGRSLSKSPRSGEGPGKILEKIGEHIQLTKEEWAARADEMLEDAGLKVDSHQPVFYAVKLWNALAEQTS